MRSSLVEIHSVASEIRHRKKEERNKKNHSGKIKSLWHRNAVQAKNQCLVCISNT